jgi:hypothetical protein
MVMKKIIITGLLVTLITGVGLSSVLHNNTVNAATEDAKTTTKEEDKDKLQDRSGKRPHQGDKSCQGADRVTGKSTNDTNSKTVVGAYTITISGGFETAPEDHGRPVALIASALGVPTEVFREAFSGVNPAGLDRGPTNEEAKSNKAALMKVLAPYGITNERLDEVSNYYRYNGRDGGLWKHTLATATPVLTNGKLTGITMKDAGAGYSSAPTVTITGPDGTVTGIATISFSKDFELNGSLSSITLK